MFNKKTLVVALVMALAGCGDGDSNNNNNNNNNNNGNDDNNNGHVEKIVYREFSSVLTSTDLFSGEGVAVTDKGDQVKGYNILTSSGVAKPASSEVEFTNDVSETRCSGARGSEITEVLYIGNGLSLVKLKLNKMVETISSKSGFVSCSVNETTEIYVVRHSDGKAWSASDIYTDAYIPLSSQNIQKPYTSKNNTDETLINKYVGRDHITYTLKLSGDNDDKLVYKELVKLKTDDGMPSGVVYDGKYIATSIYYGGKSTDYYFEVATGYIPEFARGINFNNSMPIVNRKHDGMVRVDNTKDYHGYNVLLMKDGTAEEIRYDFKHDGQDFVHVRGMVNTIYTGNNIDYVVTSNSSILSNNGGVAISVHNPHFDEREEVLATQESKGGSSFTVINTRQALVLDYATGELTKIYLNNGNLIKDAKTAKLSESGILTYSVSGASLFETVFKTLNVNTGEFGEERIITSEDGRKVIEVLPVN